jgi:hypothetical protein
LSLPRSPGARPLADTSTGNPVSRYFDEALVRITEAGRLPGFSERQYRIAGEPVRLRSIGPALSGPLTRAFAHLAADPAEAPSLTVYLCHGDVVSLPSAPWEPVGRTPSTASDEEHGALMHVRDERVDGLLRVDGASVSMLDHASRVGLFWTASPDRVPAYERAAPLRAILDWWGGDRGCRVLHAGAVGTDRGGVLLVGNAGAGKSTAALACLGSGLLYAGDDGVAVSRGPKPFVHSLYCTAKLRADHLRGGLPHLASLLDDSEQAHQGKRMFFLARERSAALTAGFPLRAVLLPRVTTSERSTTRRVSAGSALLALAPSTLFQLPGARQQRLHHIADALRRVPAHVLDLGSDLATVAPAIRALLDDATC